MESTAEETIYIVAYITKTFVPNVTSFIASYFSVNPSFENFIKVNFSL